MRDSSASYVSAQAIDCFTTTCQHSHYVGQALNHCIHFVRAIASKFWVLLRDDLDHPPCHYRFETIEHEGNGVNLNQLSSFGPFFEAAFRLESICSEP